MADEILITPEEAGRRLGLGRVTVYKLIAEERIKSVKVGKSRRVLVDGLYEFVETLTIQQSGVGGR